MKKIELSPQTFEILKNFVLINPNILLQPGNTISTISEGGNIFAYANVQEVFPEKFGIYDLNSFLAAISTFDQPVLEFSEEKNTFDGGCKFVTISEKDGKGKFVYFGSPEKVLKFITKQFQMPAIVAEFEITKAVLTKTLRAGQMAQLNHFIIESNKQGIDLAVGNIDIDASNSYRCEVADIKTSDKFTTILDINTIKVLPGAYNVALDGKLVARFANDDKKLTYFIAIDRKSTYGKLYNE